MPAQHPKALTLLAVLAAVGALYLARVFFIPISLAIFFHVMLAPLLRKLELLRVPTPLAATLVLLGMLGAVGACAIAISGPAETWIEHAPESLHKAKTRFQSWLAPMQRVTEAAADLSQSAGKSNETGPRAAAPTPAPPQFLQDIFGTTAALIAGSVEVMLVLFLLMASGGIFLKRLVALLPERADKRTAVAVYNEVESAVSGYLFATLLINIGEALLVGMALWALGMPDPILWGVLTFVLEFIPYIGGALLVTLLTVSALSTADTLGHAILMPLTYLVISALQNYVVSPIFYGNRLKLNAVAVLLAVFFWWSLWGTFGAFLAVPILAATKVLCDHIETLGPIGKFLEA